jgi:hypothetical protein
MRRSRLIWLAFAILLALLGARLWPESGERYRGLTASQWESEIRHWEPWAQVWSNKTGQQSHWGRKQPFWASWLEQVGMKLGKDRRDMPLLQGDPTAVPVLAELLLSPNPHARLIAAEGLERIGEAARPAVPALIRALDDEDSEVRQQVEQALFRIDRSAAERMGLEWTMFGLIRHDR